MNCTTCLQSKPIPVCTEEIVIGTITDFATEVLVKIKNLSTSRVDYLTITSGGAGEITIAPANFPLMAHAYQITVVEVDNPLTEKEITVDGEGGTCVEFIVEDGSVATTTLTLR